MQHYNNLDSNTCNKQHCKRPILIQDAHVKGRKIIYNVVWSLMSEMLKLVRTINLQSFETDIANHTVEHA